MKRIVLLMIGVLLVGGALPAEAAGSCWRGRTLSGAVFNTCAGQVITCEWRDRVQVTVRMTGNGSVEGTAECGNGKANCTAIVGFFLNDACSDSDLVTAAGVLACDEAVDDFLGIPPMSWSVTCSVFD